MKSCYFLEITIFDNENILTIELFFIIFLPYFFLALKVKLMVRRPMTTLIEQGILPSPKTSPALHEQRQKLERAKIGDSLKSMIAKRPDRQELVHRHILEVCEILYFSFFSACRALLCFLLSSCSLVPCKQKYSHGQ